jgi:MFS family permease
VTLRERLGLPPLVIKLGWISFFTDACSELVYPLYPIFLVQVLKAPVASLAAMEGAAVAVASLLKAWSGIRTDRTGRRVVWIRWGYFLGNIGKPLTALAPSWQVVFGIRIADRVGKGLRTSPRDALLAGAVPEADGGRAFGYQRSMDTAGATVGVLLAALLVTIIPGQYRTIFLVAAIPGLLAVALTFLLTDPPVDATKPKPTSVVPIRELPRGFWPVLGISAVFGFASSSDTLLLLRAANLGLGDVHVILLYALINFIAVVGAYPFGVLSDRLGRKKILLVGWLMYAGVYFGLASGSAGWVPFLFAAYGLQLGLTDGVVRAWISDHAPSSVKGTAMGLYHATVGIMALLGNLAAGWVWDRFGAADGLRVSGYAALGACVLLGLYGIKTSRQKVA